MSQVMSQMKHLKNLKIPLQDIKNGTDNFDEKNCIGRGGYGRVYKGILAGNQPVAVKKLDDKGFQGKNEFYTEVRMLSQYHHKNIVTLIGFCDEGNEMILIYEYVPNGSLDTYLNDASKLNSLLWLKRLKICVGAARALDYLHYRVGKEHRVIHRDIKSSNILLDENWDAKISDFGLSRIGLSNQENTFLITNVAGTYGYCDPQYERTGILTKESDVYSFGVVLFEVLCGRLGIVVSYHDERRFLHHLARKFFKKGEIDKIIDYRIRENIQPRTLTKFSTIAYQCLQEQREKRPTMAQVVQELESALQIQEFFLLGPSCEKIMRFPAGAFGGNSQVGSEAPWCDRLFWRSLSGLVGIDGDWWSGITVGSIEVEKLATEIERDIVDTFVIEMKWRR